MWICVRLRAHTQLYGGGSTSKCGRPSSCHWLLPICRLYSYTFWLFWNLKSVLNNFNNIHRKLNFTSEPERDVNVNYLDISISRTESDFVSHIYRKPTFSETIFAYDSGHPEQHKDATVRFLYNRLHTRFTRNSKISSIEEKTQHSL